MTLTDLREMLNKMFNFVPLPPLTATANHEHRTEVDRKIQYCGEILLVDTFFFHILRDFAIAKRLKEKIKIWLGCWWHR
jgi:hypothetical protein